MNVTIDLWDGWGKGMSALSGSGDIFKNGVLILLGCAFVIVVIKIIADMGK